MMKTLRHLLPLLLTSLPSLLSAQSDNLLSECNKHWSMQELVAAEECYKQAINTNPENHAVHAQLAALMMSQNRNSEAIEAYQAAIINDPENPKLFAALSLSYLHQGMYTKAQTMINHALTLNPGLKNVQDLSRYIEAKLKQMEQ